MTLSKQAKKFLSVCKHLE